MSSALIASLEKMLGSARDGALLRYSLGNEFLKSGNPQAAADHLREAVARDPGYSAAWKLLGRALAECGDPKGALDAWRTGIGVAGKKGDKQAAREMGVFARRIEKELTEISKSAPPDDAR